MKLILFLFLLSKAKSFSLICDSNFECIEDPKGYYMLYEQINLHSILAFYHGKNIDGSKWPVRYFKSNWKYLFFKNFNFQLELKHLKILKIILIKRVKIGLFNR